MGHDNLGPALLHLTSDHRCAVASNSLKSRAHACLMLQLKAVKKHFKRRPTRRLGTSIIPAQTATDARQWSKCGVQLIHDVSRQSQRAICGSKRTKLHASVCTFPGCDSWFRDVHLPPITLSRQQDQHAKMIIYTTYVHRCCGVLSAHHAGSRYAARISLFADGGCTTSSLFRLNNCIAGIVTAKRFAATMLYCEM